MKVAIPTTMLVASVLAAPTTEESSVLSTRNTNLYQSDDGYAIVEYGDGAINYGTRLPSSVLDIIRDECGETSCNPSGGYSFSSLVIHNNFGNDVSFTVSVEGTFNLDGDRGSKAQLLDLAKMAFEEVYDSGVAKFEQDKIYQKGTCPGFHPNCSNERAEYADQWESTDHVHVRINRDDDTLAGFLNIGVARANGGINAGVCASLSAASAGVGLVNAAAGAGISMLSIGCGLL